MRRFVALLIAIGAVTFSADAHQKSHGHLKFAHPYTMETESGTTDASVLMTISNESDTQDALVGASTPVAGSATVVSGGGVKSHRIVVPPGGKIELVKTGAHISLGALRTRLVGYDTFPLKLQFEHAGEVEVEVMVEERE